MAQRYEKRCMTYNVLLMKAWESLHLSTLMLLFTVESRNVIGQVRATCLRIILCFTRFNYIVTQLAYIVTRLQFMVKIEALRHDTTLDLFFFFFFCTCVYPIYCTFHRFPSYTLRHNS